VAAAVAAAARGVARVAEARAMCQGVEGLASGSVSRLPFIEACQQWQPQVQEEDLAPATEASGLRVADLCQGISMRRHRDIRASVHLPHQSCVDRPRHCGGSPTSTSAVLLSVAHSQDAQRAVVRARPDTR
jgi:hypothetical protein